MDNNNSDNYLTFINQSNTSIHSLLDLIRQQDQNYYNLLHLPPPAASYIPRSVSNLLPRSRRNSFHNRHERPTSIFMGSHRTTPLSFPSMYLILQIIIIEFYHVEPILTKITMIHNLLL
jgi:hypothetical protein